MTKNSPASSAQKADPAASADSKVKLSAEALAARMPNGWQGDAALIWREWNFPTYLDGVHFAERVAQQAEAVKHHPDLLITYKKVRVSYTTHDAGGVTGLDLEEAASLDELR
ncbi:4a-hydroxytetrahydrobiopterin dehydratase [Deinococcus radiomollis]|uniref:4a-hydroxytetrahydrobiopterin dehydratase n=1 Tax=Deinococcus radiomollis TaxID=468916 RepID=UPI003891562A